MKIVGMPSGNLESAVRSRAGMGLGPGFQGIINLQSMLGIKATTCSLLLFFCFALHLTEHCQYVDVVPTLFRCCTFVCNLLYVCFVLFNFNITLIVFASVLIVFIAA